MSKISPTGRKDRKLFTRIVCRVLYERGTVNKVRISTAGDLCVHGLHKHSYYIVALMAIIYEWLFQRVSALILYPIIVRVDFRELFAHELAALRKNGMRKNVSVNCTASQKLISLSTYYYSITPLRGTLHRPSERGLS